MYYMLILQTVPFVLQVLLQNLTVFLYTLATDQLKVSNHD